jgi:hypothetical protein
MMANHALNLDDVAMKTNAQAQTSGLDRVSAAYALSAAVTVIFNTVLAWVKDAYDPLNTAMAHLSGHHWTTHGIVDVLLFLVLGFVFMSTGTAERMAPKRLVTVLVGSTILAGAGLAAWFFLV